MIFLFTLVCLVFVIVMICINDNNRLRNICFSIIVICVLLAQLAQHSLSLGDSIQVNYLSLFNLNRQTLADLIVYFYIISFISLIGYLYSGSRRR